MRIPILFATVLCCSVSFFSAHSEIRSRPEIPDDGDFSDTLDVLLRLEESDIDLAWSKLVMDSLIQPGVDASHSEQTIQSLAEVAISMAGPAATDQQKIGALRTVIYEPGPWNSQQPFSYDFDNPNGRLAKNKTLHEYIATRKGNCVNMPILFMLVGERMGLDLNITTAPRHVFVQFDDSDSDELIHLEPTSGALPQRIVWQRKVLPMTDRAIESGMYMKALSKREQVSTMAETLLQALREQEDFDEMLEVAELMSSAYPQSDIALLNAADASRKLIQREILPLYRTSDAMPPEVRAKFDRLALIHDNALAQLEYLGWRPAQVTEHVVIPK